jgi:hypothetical protein
MVYEIVAGRSASQKEKLGLTGTILIGKNYVKFDLLSFRQSAC